MSRDNTTEKLASTPSAAPAAEAATRNPNNLTRIEQTRPVASTNGWSSIWQPPAKSEKAPPAQNNGDKDGYVAKTTFGHCTE